MTPEPVGIASRFELRTRFLGRSVPLEYEIVELEPGDRIVLRAENAFVRSVDTMTFESLPGGALTVVTYLARLDAKGPLRLAGPLLAPAFRRIGDRAAAGLRLHLKAVHSA